MKFKLFLEAEVINLLSKKIAKLKEKHGVLKKSMFTKQELKQLSGKIKENISEGGFKRYLTEARDTTKGKGVTFDEIKNIQKQLTRALRPDMTDQLSKTKIGSDDAWELGYRVYDLFTPRPREEDDDYPDFTGDKKLDKILKPILKGIGYRVTPEEKYWLSIDIKAKKLNKKELRADAKKQTELVRRKLKFAEVDVYDKFLKEKFNDTIVALKKHKNKFIKKEQFIELAKKANFRWDNDEIENFWLEIK